MTDAVLVAVIGVVGTLISIILTARVNGKVRRIRNQVENDHGDINMRDEADSRHKANTAFLHEIKSGIGGIRDQLRQLTEADLILMKRADRHDEQLAEFEKTHPPHHQFMPPGRHRKESP